MTSDTAGSIGIGAFYQNDQFCADLVSRFSIFKYCYQKVDARCDCGKTGGSDGKVRELNSSLATWQLFAVSKRAHGKIGILLSYFVS